MKKYLFVCFFLLGCDKKPRLIQETPIEYVAFAGQSNVLAGNGLSSSFVSTAINAGRIAVPIECAVGGTYIDEWQKGQPLYESCLSKMKVSPPKTIIWWQGEADAHSIMLAQGWSAKFEHMIRDIRADLGYSVYIVYVQLGDRSSGEMAGPAWQEMRRQQASVSVPNAHMMDVTFADSYRKINSDGNPDVHYTRDGYAIIGGVLTEVYFNEM